MIQYHGGPISDPDAAVRVWKGRHALVSWPRAHQLALIQEIATSYCLDNGAFSFWRSGHRPDWNAYIDWVEAVRTPNCDFAILPDAIGAGADANDKLLEQFSHLDPSFFVPVWHMDEPIERLQDLGWWHHRVAIGSAGDYATPATPQWWRRIREAFDACSDHGYVIPKLHGLRMLDPNIFSQLPFASADSSNIARNLNLDTKWSGTYAPATKAARALTMLDRVEAYNAPTTWPPQSQTRTFARTPANAPSSGQLFASTTTAFPTIAL